VTLFIWCTAALFLFMSVRLTAAWFVRKRGCDAWYFLLCAEQLRLQRRFPVRLPSLYILEPDEQWYPPGFMVFCALFPVSFIKKYHWAIAHLVDGLIACILFFGGYALTGQITPALWGVAVYALFPALLDEYSSLTSRPLGCLFQLAFVMFTYGWIHKSVWLIIPAVFFGVLLFYTHKLSMQTCWFLFPFFAITDRHIDWLFMLLFAYSAAFLVRPGFFLKIVRAHWDIVRFWNKNWPWLAAHQVNDSPVYGKHPSRAGYYAKSLFSLSSSFIRFALSNVTIVFTFIALFAYNQLNGFAQFGFWWIIGMHVWAMAIQFLPFLRCIGIGIQYMKYAYLPSIFLAQMIFITIPENQMVFAIIALAILIVLCYKYFRRILYSVKHNTEPILSADLEAQLLFLKDSPDARIMVLPLNLADMAAYVTRRPVCWGTHGYGFIAASDVLPILRKPLSWLMERYALTHLLLDERYATADTLGVSHGALISRFGVYALYALNKDSFLVKETVTIVGGE